MMKSAEIAVAAAKNIFMKGSAGAGLFRAFVILSRMSAIGRLLPLRWAQRKPANDPKRTFAYQEKVLIKNPTPLP